MEEYFTTEQQNKCTKIIWKPIAILSAWIKEITYNIKNYSCLSILNNSHLAMFTVWNYLVR
jgi:hypothetical protein